MSDAHSWEASTPALYAQLTIIYTIVYELLPHRLCGMWLVLQHTLDKVNVSTFQFLLCCFQYVLIVNLSKLRYTFLCALVPSVE